ncbi:orotidine-5'-phosphate decarboxylase [Sediminispirochaeta smaragdinae]|uniref:Orotidine-5'-phosphate decarboxylase n=1 Tax=Sediminispirochaeta smaragdinae (strain DSM 11293 / JCM 15392 / SEBR 4228) TaxID=573413 RepID=E1R527_SEDSS|nr:orotidine-5'-phosphate decarboxylase [Sediminispirochaeta smaragdinae]ADK80562.1 orotidine 5'-phosphate decarboxylase [Sediminispirochaeta smaragdinae DSM 11293]
MYIESLRTSAQKQGNIVCLGLDPLPEHFPFEELPPAQRVIKTFETLFDRMITRSLYPAAFKPNIGYYHRLDRPREGNFSGSKTLAQVLTMIEEAFPGVPVILDAKRGDIASSSANYAQEAFACWKADAVTVAPYMGSDSTGPFVSWCEKGKGVYILNRTSNPSGAELQNLELRDDAGGLAPLYMTVARAIAESAARFPGCGAVVGATNPQELGRLSAFYASKQVPLLIPGVGGQGGSAGVTVRTLSQSGYPIDLARINSSSGITHPWVKQKLAPPPDWDRLSTDALARLIEEISREF